LITGSEDTHVKVSIFKDNKLQIHQTFSNHVASVRAIGKTKIGDSQHIIVSAGSRLEANVYKIVGTQMSHICHFMRSFEQNTNDQDLRIMAVSVFHSGSSIFTAFGLSSGAIEFHRINL
jgi:hypothetical protein